MDHHNQYWLNWGSIHERWIEKSFPSRKGVNWGENGRRHQSVSLDLARLSIRVSIPPAASASIIFSSLTTPPSHSWIIERFGLGICWTLFTIIGYHFLSLKQRKEMFLLVFFRASGKYGLYLHPQYNVTVKMQNCHKECQRGNSGNVRTTDWVEAWWKWEKGKFKLELGPMKVSSTRATREGGDRLCADVHWDSFSKTRLSGGRGSEWHSAPPPPVF